MNYHFDQDWFSVHIPLWERLLKPLQGTPCNILEIGSYQGKSSFWMAEYLLQHHSESRLTCIDKRHVDKYYKMPGEVVFLSNLAKCPQKDQINYISEDSTYVLPTLPSRAYDFIYIDGGHEAFQVLTDWVHCFRLVKVGGIICFDDYEWQDPCKTVEHLPKPAINAVLLYWKPFIQVLHKEYQVWLKVMSVPS